MCKCDEILNLPEKAQVIWGAKFIYKFWVGYALGTQKTYLSQAWNGEGAK